MKLIPWKRRKEFFSEEEKQLIVQAIQKAEQRTSGEIRLYIESKCRFMNALDRAEEIFFQFRMHETALRNATLIYIAVRDHQFAVMGDEGIHQKVGMQYWVEVRNHMLTHFKQNHLVDAICTAVHDLGEALRENFPYDSHTDKNELPDDIIFGS